MTSVGIFLHNVCKRMPWGLFLFCWWLVINTEDSASQPSEAADSFRESVAGEGFHASENHLQPEVKITEPPKTIRVGEKVGLTIEFSWKGGEDDYRFIVPRIGASNLNEDDISQTVEVFPTGRVVKRFVFYFTPVEPGQARLESFAFSYVGEDPAKPKEELKIPSLTFTVKPEATRGWNIGNWWWGGLFLGLGLISGSLLWLKRRATARTKSHLSDAESLEEATLKMFGELNGHSEETARVIQQASQLFTQYCKAKWGLVPPFNSSNLLGRSDLDREDHSEIVLLSREMSTYKFSGQELSRRDCERFLDRIRRFILRHQVVEPSSTN